MEEIANFVAGFQRFQARYFGEDVELFDQLRQGQHPKALFVACCDSRVAPALLTGCDPGELFVVRNVANLVPPCESDGGYHGVSAALEFGVCILGVGHVIVMGHSQCGGIAALMSGAEEYRSGSFVSNWMKIAEKARRRVVADLPHKSRELQCRACEQASILLSLENLLSFAWIRERVESGKLRLHGWYFDLERGELSGYDLASEKFIPFSLTATI